MRVKGRFISEELIKHMETKPKAIFMLLIDIFTILPWVSLFAGVR